MNKGMGLILALVAAVAGVVLFVVLGKRGAPSANEATTNTAPIASGATTPAAAAAQVAAAAASSGNSTAQNLAAAAALVGAVGGALSGLGLEF